MQSYEDFVKEYRIFSSENGKAARPCGAGSEFKESMTPMEKLRADTAVIFDTIVKETGLIPFDTTTMWMFVEEAEAMPFNKIGRVFMEALVHGFVVGYTMASKNEHNHLAE